MRYLLLASALLALLLSSVPTAMSQDSLPHVERTVIVSYGGLLYVVDRIRDFDAIVLRYGIPDFMKNALERIDVIGGEFKFVGRTFEGANLYEIKPAQDVITIIAAYRGLVTYLESNTYELVISPIPYIDEWTINATVVFLNTEHVKYTTSQEGFEVTDRGLEGKNIIFTGKKPSPTASIRFSSEQLAVVEVKKLKYSYETANDVLEMYILLRNLIERPLSSIVLTLPHGVKVLDVEDSLGPLFYSYDEGSGRLTVDLERNRYSLAKDWRLGFTVKMDEVEKVGVAKRGTQYVSITPFRPINATIKQVDVSFVLPDGVEPVEKDIAAELYRRPAGELVVELGTKPPLELLGNEVKLAVKGSPPVNVAPWLLVAGLAVLGIGITTLRALSRRVPRAAVPRELLEGVVKEIERLVSLAGELERLSAETRNPRSVQNAIQERVSAVRRGRERIKEHLSNMERYDRTLTRDVQEVERAADELYEAAKALATNYAEFARGQLSKAAYERVGSTLRRDLRRGRVSLNDGLFRLRSALK